VSTGPRTATITRELEAICGTDYVRADDAALLAHTIDTVTPQAVVSPGTPEEVAGVLKFAATRDLVVIPAGGFSHQHIGRVPPRIDIVLKLSRMNALQYYEPGDLTLGVQAGASLHDLQAQIAAHGQVLPIDAPSASRATVGGAIASAGSGPLRHGYGTVRDFCLGVQFATADGKVAKAGGRVVKNVAGYDVTKLIVGSYGTLAVITAANFRVFPRPRQTRTFAAQFHRFDDAINARDQLLLHSHLPFLALEIISPGAERVVAPRFARQAWALLLRAGGSENVLGRYRHELGTMVTWEADDDEERLWNAVTDLPDTICAREHGTMVVRAAAPAQKLADILRAAEAASQAYGFDFTCAGRAVMPVHLAFSPEQPTANYAAIVSEIRNTVGRDGSVVVTHCPTEVKASIDIWGTTATDLDAMRLVKRTLDPGDILNRGRFVV
jgi:glycolate oxidase FAD binding subunit